MDAENHPEAIVLEEGGEQVSVAWESATEEQRAEWWRLRRNGVAIGLPWVKALIAAGMTMTEARLLLSCLSLPRDAAGVVERFEQEDIPTGDWALQSLVLDFGELRRLAVAVDLGGE